MSGFTKLDSGIVHSTIWVQPHDVLRVWVALLALADQHGFARTAAPALANLCMVPVERMREILALLEAPDEDSRTATDEGRRIRKVDGGWLLVNHGAYRAARDPDKDRARKREWDRQHRPSGHRRARQSDASPKKSDESPPGPTQAEAEAEADRKLRDTSDPSHACAREDAAGGFEGPHLVVPREATAPTLPGLMAIALCRAGFQATSMNPRVIAYARAGGTVEHLEQLAANPDCAGKSAGYVLSWAMRELSEQGAAVAAGSALVATGAASPPTGRRLSKQAEGMLSLARLKTTHRSHPE